MKPLKPLIISGKEVLPLVEGGKGVAITNGGKTWTPQVRVYVDDQDHNPVAGGTVTGRWGTGEMDSCTTNASGYCEMLGGPSAAKNTRSVDFSVLNIDVPESAYLSGANHDEDNDSDGTTITVSK